ncbi:hypothetical protein H0H93_007331 [Arthromyces matolae]|nr:hypothetical protein H0H93_007331 [Arthromyces matolae]
MVNKREIHTQPPFRAEHIGSFLRPNELHQRRILSEKNEINVEDLHKAEEDAIKAIVNVQRAIGIRSITDGEFRRRVRNVFHDGIFDKLEGVKAMLRPIDEFLPYASSVSVARAQGLTTYPSFYCNGKIKRTESFRVEDFKFLKGLVQPRVLCIPPGITALAH